MVEWGIFPSSPRRGGCAIKKTSRSILSSRRRGGVQPQQNSVEFDHHPVRSIKEASRYFVDVASTPPQKKKENCRRAWDSLQSLRRTTLVHSHFAFAIAQANYKRHDRRYHQISLINKLPLSTFLEFRI